MRTHLEAKEKIGDFGLPYACADFDEDDRYHVVCPICQVRCYPEGSMGEATAEDDATKGAGMVYALHFEREMEEGR